MNTEVISKTQKEMIQKRNRIIAPILIGIAIVLAVAVLKPAYSTYIEKQSLLTVTAGEKTKKTEQLVALKQLQAQFQSGVTSDFAKKIQKLDHKLSNTELMRAVMINDYTRPTGSQNAAISISTIAVDKGVKLPNGLSLAHVNVGIQGNSLSDVVDFLTYLTKDSEYSFILDEISLPIDTAPDTTGVAGGFGLALSLGVYYYE